MSADRAAAQSSDLAGEASPSHSEGLRPDTRTSNSEDWDGPAIVSVPDSTGAVKGESHAQVGACLVSYEPQPHTPPEGCRCHRCCWLVQ